MAIEISDKNYNNELLFGKEQVLLRFVVGLTIRIVLTTNTLIYINLYLQCNNLSFLQFLVSKASLTREMYRRTGKFLHTKVDTLYDLGQKFHDMENG